MPLSSRQIAALAHAAVIELASGLPTGAREVGAWRARARQIPNSAIRADALSSLACKRANADGAAFFWTIPRTRSLPLLRMLVAYQILWDFLDSVNERGATVGQANGRQLHLALIEAFNPGGPVSDYYRYHPWNEDGGYLYALVEACREACGQLPAFGLVKASLIKEATRAQVLAVNHELDPILRDHALRQCAAEERHEHLEVHWFELTGAATASLTIHALLALGAEPSCTESDVELTLAAYYPWISATATMLDSYVDRSEDLAKGEHCYIAHYPTSQFAIRRLRQLIQRSLSGARALPDGERHALVVACMVAMYLSKNSACTEEMRATTASLVSAGGSLTKTLLPILRGWRIAYALRAV